MCFDNPLVLWCASADPGPHITLYNNSVDEVFKTRPPRTFQAEVYFALKWDKNTVWFLKRDQVNLTIKCDEQVFKVGLRLHPLLYCPSQLLLRKISLFKVMPLSTLFKGAQQFPTCTSVF